ncbi:2-octaprenyl-3-methyl-6-methoxy-1,4-benzoquinol hydroxylase [Halomonas sp. THAF5a]|uniref:UbiH/UbiF/VisC/COQ6 family ubiquinone biosynthesis hydroxylase n=1 Tax=Halomonas sp. THAF5a TaxID=2587844 RepID=UPI0012688970|nr:UbiH/UbiF/VisC/COQ6 family ubiquinone biosynthesis hydroxylase [Halomonas sp. THAF5a]QFU00256.1 2-octaprenyl-3-methyl-6-methoxy-1,4-benzoquinol hydroxylase [Halomonas sp. THAF5a]
MDEILDTLIVGGGMVGAATAVALAQAGLRVAMVEGGEPPEAIHVDAPFDLRVSSLNLASQRLLEAIGAWAFIPEARRCPFQHIEASDEAGRRHVRFSAEALELPDFGHFVENRVIRRALWQRLAEMPRATVITGAGPAAWLPGGQHGLLELDDGRLLAARLVVGADGAASRTRQLAGIATRDEEYGQRALIINVQTRLPQQDVSWQRFTARGPRAMLPLPGHRASLVWYDDDAATRAREELDDETLCRAIERDFPDRLGGVEAVLGRASFPIRRRHAERYVRPRLALVGDAAHVIHPLAGQGLNLGLQDAEALSRRVIAAFQAGEDPGERRLLAGYARERRPQTLAMIAAMETFHRVFTGTAALRRAGAAGLAVADRLTGAKRQVMRHALGL